MSFNLILVHPWFSMYYSAREPFVLKSSPFMSLIPDQEKPSTTSQ